jgi:hypothetical protein
MSAKRTIIYRNVLQKQARGCGLAVLSIVTGHDYDTISAYLPSGDYNEHGLYLRGVDDYLVDHGFAIARKFRYRGFFVDGRSSPRESWPPEPWADVHLCEVEVYEKAPCYHFVVLLRNGTVLDPLTTTTKKLSDYYAVHNVAAVYNLIEANL